MEAELSNCGVDAIYSGGVGEVLRNQPLSEAVSTKWIVQSRQIQKTQQSEEVYDGRARPN
jgi:hypothetical protein